MYKRGTLHICFYKYMCSFFMKKTNSQNENISLKKKIADISGVPSEVVLGAPILTVTGNYEMLIMNYRGIIEYTDDMVRIQTKTGQIKVYGKRLGMDYYTNDEMKISGKIISIEYC